MAYKNNSPKANHTFASAKVIKWITFIGMIIMLSYIATAVTFSEAQSLHQPVGSTINTLAQNFAECTNFTANDSYPLSGLAYAVDQCDASRFYNLTLRQYNAGGSPGNILFIVSDNVACATGLWVAANNSVSSYSVTSGTTYWSCIASKTSGNTYHTRGISLSNGMYYANTAYSWTGVLPFAAGLKIIKNLVTPGNNLNVTLLNKTLSVKTSVNEEEYFRIFVNYTNSTGGGVLNAQCSYQSYNISANFYNTTTDYDLTVSTDRYLLQSSYYPENNSYNVIKFRVCKTSPVNKNIDVYVNQRLHHTVQGNIIPQCPSYHEETNRTDSNITSTYINVSLGCSACTPAQAIRIVKDKDDFGLVLERFYSYHTGNVSTYNASSSLYYESETDARFNHFHSYINPGTYPINVTCNNDTYTRSFIVTALPPSVALISLTDYNGEKNFTDLVNAESGNITILGECSGEFITQVNYSLKYSNNTIALAQSGISEIFDIESSYMGVDDIYNVTMTCLDDDGQINSTFKRFILNDSISPYFMFNSPKSDNSSVIYQNTSLSIDVTMTDLNLFSVEVYCKDSLNVPKHYFYTGNITGGIFQYINNTDTFTNLGTGECNFTAKDRHTDADISKFNIIKHADDDKKVLRYEYSGAIVNITIDNDVNDIKTIQEKDRITFEPVLKVKTGTKQIDYRITCETGKLHHFDDDEINEDNDKYGHSFLCGDIWTDFLIDGLEYKNIKVVDIGQDKYRVTIYNVDKLNSLKTKSIGIVNTVTQYVSFDVQEEPPPADVSSITTGEAVFYGILIFVWAIFIITGLVLGTFAVGIMISLIAIALGIFIGITMLQYAVTLSIFFIGISVIAAVIMILGLSRD